MRSLSHFFWLPLLHDQDVVTARQRTADLASRLGFDRLDQTRLATAASEIVRNAFRYGVGGEVSFSITDGSPQRLVITVRDHGPGIANLDEVLAGTYQSPTGLGMGIAGARRLLDHLAISTSAAGTTVVMEKMLSPQARHMTADDLRGIVGEMERRRPHGLLEEFQQQNQELLRALDELQKRQQELVQLNRELEDTNRGVVALYAELDERAVHLRRADELKSRFLSNMTHEFRTPVNAIIGLCNLLAEDRPDGRPVEPEVGYIRKAADQLLELVNDLLDLAKVAAGKTDVRVSDVDIERLFGALRGMFRPLLHSRPVTLVFEGADRMPLARTDEAKISQILRNLISNALKFTREGAVQISVALDRGDCVTFTVTDTGIGIAADDQQRIFDEFTQVENPLQRVVRGTGLGLPLSRRLAELLGGTLRVESEPGIGSRFYLTVPRDYSTWRGEGDARAVAPATGGEHIAANGPGRIRVLVVEDEEVSRFLIRQCLPAETQIVEVTTAEDGLERAAQDCPDVILLDLVLPGMPGAAALTKLQENPATRNIPVIVVTATALDATSRAALLEYASAVMSKAELAKDTLGESVRRALKQTAGASRPV